MSVRITLENPLEIVQAENGFICYYGDNTYIAKDEWEIKDIIKEVFSGKNVSNRGERTSISDNDT